MARLPGWPPAAAPGADDISTRPTISDDGQVVAFVSDVCNLVPEQPQMAGFDGVIVVLLCRGDRSSVILLRRVIFMRRITHSANPPVSSVRVFGRR